MVLTPRGRQLQRTFWPGSRTKSVSSRLNEIMLQNLRQRRIEDIHSQHPLVYTHTETGASTPTHTHNIHIHIVYKYTQRHWHTHLAHILPTLSVFLNPPICNYVLKYKQYVRLCACAYGYMGELVYMLTCVVQNLPIPRVSAVGDRHYYCWGNIRIKKPLFYTSMYRCTTHMIRF